MDYACFIYDSTYVSMKRTLDTVHHSAIRIATGAFRTTPTVSLLAEAYEPPLALRRQLLGMRYAVKLCQFPSHPTYEAVFGRSTLSVFRNSGRETRSRCEPLCLRVKRLFADSGVEPRNVKRDECPQVPPWQLLLPSIDTSLSEMTKGETIPEVFKARALQHLSSYDQHTTVFTDGSKSEDGVGCAFVLGDTSRAFTLPKHASVFTSELVAIIKALCYIEVDNGNSYLILSDSLSSLIALRMLYPSNALVQEILQRVTVLTESGTTITFCWIPGHVGIAGNERADAAAKRAAQRPSTRRFPVPARDFYSTISTSLIGV